MSKKKPSRQSKPKAQAKKKLPARLAKKKKVVLPKGAGAAALASLSAPEGLKIDFGCGSRKKEGFYGVDILAMDGVDLVLDLGDPKLAWPWPDNSVREAHCSHFLEHLEVKARTHFLNELHRVLIPGGTATIIVPYWASSRAYGDITHAWPPIGEMTFYYWSRAWRLANAPHTDIQWNRHGFSCDFDFGCGYNTHQNLIGKSDVVQQFEINFYKEAAQDIVGTITKCVPQIAVT